MRVSSISGVALALVTAGEVLAAGKANTFAIVGHTGVSAQQLFLGNEKKVSEAAGAKQEVLSDWAPSPTAECRRVRRGKGELLQS